MTFTQIELKQMAYLLQVLFDISGAAIGSRLLRYRVTELTVSSVRHAQESDDLVVEDGLS